MPAESLTEVAPIVAAPIVAAGSLTEAAPIEAAPIEAGSPTGAATIAAAAGTPALQPEPPLSALQPQARTTTTTITPRSADIIHILPANSRCAAPRRYNADGAGKANSEILTGLLSKSGGQSFSFHALYRSEGKND